jgi:parvulin-like peptidyl-prolyl isomerase
MPWKIWRGILAALLVAGLGAERFLLAAEEAWSARVGEQVILASDVERELLRAVKELPQDPALVNRLRKAALEQCVREALALEWLKAQGQAASAADVDLALGRRKKEVVAQSQSWEEYLGRMRHSEQSLRRELLWRLSWARYLEKQLTDVNLERYFQRHKTEFDGTQLRVAHILLKAGDAQSAESAKSLRDQIVQGKMKFAEAARQHSQSPTAAQGGDIGFIERYKPMPESFSRAAFALKSGEVSAPVQTRFGWHVITVLETKPGSGKWQDSHEELTKAVTGYLFEWTSERQREKVKVQYADAAAAPPTKD